jgi:hypothetical protein
MMRWGKENRYKIVAGSWAVGMGTAWYYINKNRFMTTSQKIVQVRMYAQALCLLALVATAVFEVSDAKRGQGRWEEVMVVDRSDPEHHHMKKIERQVVPRQESYQGQDLWKGESVLSVVLGQGRMLTSWTDMVAAEEKRIQERKDKKEANDASARTEGGQ